jgi:hypothetical protein
VSRCRSISALSLSQSSCWIERPRMRTLTQSDTRVSSYRPFSLRPASRCVASSRMMTRTLGLLGLSASIATMPPTHPSTPRGSVATTRARRAE